VPKGGGYYTVGNPYRIAGKTYIPRDNPRYAEVGVASWYGSAFHGRTTANGEVYDVNGLTAAHPTLPLPSYVRVTNLVNGRSLVVRVNDRGPFADDRIIDVSARVADMLDFRRVGTARVKVEYVGPAQMDGLDARKLLATYRAPDPRSAPGRLAPWQSAPAPAFVVAAAPPPTPRRLPARLPDDAFQPTPAAGDPLVLMPAFTPASIGGGDPLAPLITRLGVAASYADEAAPATAAHQAVADLARSGLAPALQLAATRKAAELAGSPVIVQVGSFADRSNAERASAAFGRFGTAEIRTRDAAGNVLHVLCVAVGPGASAEGVIAAAADMGLRGAFILRN
jgi:rare lipoprotein A